MKIKTKTFAPAGPRPSMGLGILLFTICCIATQRPALATVELNYRNERTRQLLMEAAANEDRVQRVLAADALLKAEPARNAEILTRFQADPVEAVRRSAVATTNLAAPTEDFKPRPLVPESQWSLTHRDPRVRQALRLKLLESDATYKEDFSSLLDDPDYFVRRNLSAMVVKSRGAASLETWRKLVVSARVEDRVEAAWAFGKLESKQDEAAVLECVRAESERLRLIATETLGVVGGDMTRGALGELIVKTTEKTQEALLRLVDKLQARTALPILREMALKKDVPIPARVLVLDALATMTDIESKPALLKVIKDYDPSYSLLREHAAGAIASNGVQEAIPTLKVLLTEKPISVPTVGLVSDHDPSRIACLQALVSLKEDAYVRALIDHKCVTEMTEPMRKSLAEVLTKVTGKRHDFRPGVQFKDYFVEALEEPEYPSEISEKLKKPPVFVTE